MARYDDIFIKDMLKRISRLERKASDYEYYENQLTVNVENKLKDLTNKLNDRIGEQFDNRHRGLIENINSIKRKISVLEKKNTESISKPELLVLYKEIKDKINKNTGKGHERNQK